MSNTDTEKQNTGGQSELPDTSGSKSDFDKLKELFESFGMEFNNAEFYRDGVRTKEIDLIAGDRKVKGYSGFFTEFVFDQDGKFLNASVWE